MMQFITDHGAALMAIAALLLSTAHAIVALTPSKRDDEIEAKIESVLAGLGIKAAPAK